MSRDLTHEVCFVYFVERVLVVDSPIFIIIRILLFILNRRLSFVLLLLPYNYLYIYYSPEFYPIVISHLIMDIASVFNHLTFLLGGVLLGFVYSYYIFSFSKI